MRSVYIEYVCPYCGRKQFTKVLEIPEPNFEAQDVARSFVCRKYVVQCKNARCQQKFEIDICNSTMGGLIEIEDLKENEVIQWVIR